MNPLRATLLVLLAAVLLPLAAGCSGRGSGITATPPASAPAGGASATATSTSTSAAGSPTPAAAQPLPPELQKVLDRVAQLRGLPAPAALKVVFLPRSQLTATLDSLITPEDRAWAARITNLYRLMGFIANNQDYMEIYRSFSGAAVLGFYSPEQDTLWVVQDDGQQLDLSNLGKELEATLAHELLHAVQDNTFDLAAADKQYETSIDSSLVFGALVEGDAVALEKAYRARYLAALPATPSGGVLLARLPGAPAAQIPNVPAAIVRELYFPYTTGADWVQQAVQAKGFSQVDAWLRQPPTATAQILRPELLDQGWQPEQVSLPDLAAALGPGFTRDSGGVIGEFQWRNWLQVQVAASTAAEAARGWSGDQYAVYKNGTSVAAVFRIRFADAAEARQFADAQASWLGRAGAQQQQSGDLALAQLPDGDVAATTGLRGNEVLFTIATDRALAEKALQALLRG